MNGELDRLKWKISDVQDDLHYHLRQTRNRMESELENLKEQMVDWCEFDEFRNAVEKEVEEFKSRIAELEARLAELEKSAILKHLNTVR